MSGKVLQIQDLVDRHMLAVGITDRYIEYSNMMAPWLASKVELRDYIMATLEKFYYLT